MSTFNERKLVSFLQDTQEHVKTIQGNHADSLIRKSAKVCGFGIHTVDRKITSYDATRRCFFIKYPTRTIHVLRDIDLLIKEGLDVAKVKGGPRDKVVLLQFRSKLSKHRAKQSIYSEKRHTDFGRIKRVFDGGKVEIPHNVKKRRLTGVIFHNISRKLKTLDSIHQSLHILTECQPEDTMPYLADTIRNQNPTVETCPDCNSLLTVTYNSKGKQVIRCSCKIHTGKFARKEDILKEVDGTGSPRNIYSEIKQILNAVPA